MFRKKQSIFVEINFAPKPARGLTLQRFKRFILSAQNEILFFSLSGITFVGIFVSNYFFNKLTEEKKQSILYLKKEINKQIRLYAVYKRNIMLESKKFYRFYIPNLKEKLFYAFFKMKFKPSAVKAIKDYQKIIGELNSVLSFALYPTYYKHFSKTFPIPVNQLVSFNKIKYIKFSSIGNPFKNPERLGIPVVTTPVVYIQKTAISSKFLHALRNIRSEDLKTNIILEYMLISKNVKDWKYYVPATILFPLNLALPNSQVYKSKMKSLNKFCNLLIINKEYKQKIFVNNRFEIKSVMDGICVKNLYQ